MSAATDTAPTPIARPPLTRLTLVELRKMLDTRAGLWLQIVAAFAMVAIVVVVGIVGNPPDHVLDQQLPAAAAPFYFLLPVVGILLVTSEWSQRTALITFTIVPQRLRVLSAKLLAGVLVALAAFAIALVVAGVGTAVTGGAWTLSLALAGQIAFSLAVLVVMGIAFGAAIQVSAAAIVIYFVLPTALSAIGSIHVLEGAARWLDVNRTTEPLTTELLSATEWARVATSLALWLLVPLAIGAWRIARQDVR